MRLSEQLWQNSEMHRTTHAGTMSTAQEMDEIVKSVHVQSETGPPLNSAQAVIHGNRCHELGRFLSSPRQGVISWHQ